MILLAALAKCVQCQQISRVLMGVVSGVNRGYVLAHCGGGGWGTAGSCTESLSLNYYNKIKLL